MGIVSARRTGEVPKYAFLIAFIIGAILTPTPDMFNMTLMSVPIYLLYEVGILGARIFGKKKGSGVHGTDENVVPVRSAECGIAEMRNTEVALSPFDIVILRALSGIPVPVNFGPSIRHSRETIPSRAHFLR